MCQAAMYSPQGHPGLCSDASLKRALGSHSGSSSPEAIGDTNSESAAAPLQPTQCRHVCIQSGAQAMDRCQNVDLRHAQHEGTIAYTVHGM